MYLFGIDNGYSYTKVVSDNEQKMFPSAITTNVISGYSHINIDGRGYCVGVGNMVSKPDKTDHEINKVCTLFSLASCGSGDYYIVAGLPIGQYKTQKDKFKEIILDYGNCHVEYRQKEIKLNIKEVTIFPQGAATLYHLGLTNGRYIIFDIGAFTVDVALIEMTNGTPSVIQYDTWFKGMSTIYSNVADVINNQYTLTLEPKDIERILVQGYFKLNGDKIDLTCIQPVIDNYLEDLYSLFDLNYKSHTTDIYLSGGGGSIVFDKFKLHYPQAELVEEAQYANAIGYYMIGLQKYYEILER
ncbi:MAG TPA: ParM/StbA family protein [Lachnospiraceae bacterium]|nr:ParM/StbA family protein [Lachnospiraceae bacterium]